MILYLADQKKQWLRKIVGIAIAFVFILKFLFGTLVGVLLLVSLLYYYSFYWLGVHPWTFGQLIFWFFELSDEAKIGLTSSLVTVFGFFIALHSTMHSWRQQTATASRMSAADDIDQIISEVGSKILQVQLFSERTAHEVLRIRTFRIHPDTEPILSVLSEEVLLFRSNRQRLIQLQQDVIALQARYSILFLPLSGMEEALDAIEADIANVVKKLWVPAPAGGTLDPQHRIQLLTQADPKMYLELVEACEEARDRIAGFHGGLRGALMSPILELNIVALSRILRQTFRQSKV